MNLALVPLELPRLDALRYEVVLLPVCEDERPLEGAAGLCDWRAMGGLSRMLKSGRASGGMEERVLAPAPARLPFERVVLCGLGLRATVDAERCARALEAMVRIAQGLRLRSCALALPGRSVGALEPARAAKMLVAAVEDTELDEVAVLDDAAALTLMAPVIQQERRRSRVARELREG